MGSGIWDMYTVAFHLCVYCFSRYDKVENRYVVQCNETTACGRRKRRYFGISRYGKSNAKYLAVRARLQILGSLAEDADAKTIHEAVRNVLGVGAAEEEIPESNEEFSNVKKGMRLGQGSSSDKGKEINRSLKSLFLLSDDASDSNAALSEAQNVSLKSSVCSVDFRKQKCD